MRTAAELRRANLRVLFAMVIFALLLALGCVLWMRAKVRAQTAAKTSPISLPSAA